MIRRLANPRTADMPTTRHGTYSGYSWWGCRCPRCVHAGRAYVNARQPAYRWRKVLELSPEPLPERRVTLVQDETVPYPAWDVVPS